jgi:Cu(I)/Ag(I) efflux system membrane fusion protein
MKLKTIFLILFVAICAAFGGWFAAKLFPHPYENNSAAQTGERKIRFYQCAMHPQVKSDKPGKCPICGMELTPIYEGQGALSENLITLDSNSVSVINVQSEPVKRATLSRTLHVAGVIQDDLTKRKIISAYNEGRIEKLLANYTGAEVEKGQPLATFYSPNLLSAEREYLVLVQNKSTNGNSVFQQEQQRLRNAAAQRLKRLGLTDAQIESLEKSTNALVQTEIVSPMSGTVIERFAYEGQYVKEGEKLFEIGDFSTMWFLFDAYESDLPWLKVGEEIEVTAPSVPGKTFQAKINFIDPNINEPTRSANVRVELANPILEHDGN